VKRLAIRRPWSFVILGLVAVGFIISQIPAAVASQWNYFGSDDIWFGRFTHSTWVETHNIFSVIGAAFYTAGHVWNAWQGNFTAVVMFSLNPAVFDEAGMHNWLGPWIVIGFLLLGTIVLCKVIFTNYLRAPWEISLTIGLLLSVAFTQLVPSYRSAFLWWAAAVNYGVFLGLIFLMVAAILKYFKTDGWRRIVYFSLTTFLACFIAGGMYVFHTLLFTAAAAAIIFKELIYKNRSGRALYFILIPYTVLSMVNIFAPGNQNRMASVETTGIRNPVTAILESILYSVKEAIWAASTGTGVAGDDPNGINFAFFALLALVLIFSWLVVKHSNFKFRLPGLVFVASFLVYSSYYTPFIYAQGTDIKPRVFDCGYYIWWFVIILNAIWIMGWLKPRLIRYHKRNKLFFSENLFGRQFGLVQLVSFPVLVAVFLAGYFNMTNFVNGYLGIRPGALGNYDAITETYTANGVSFGRTLPEVNVEYIEQFKADLAKSDATVTLPDTRENDKLLTAHLDMCPLPGYGYNQYAEVYWGKEHVQAYYPSETSPDWRENIVIDESYQQQKEQSCQGQEHLNS
jgi:hypothetical protein